MIKKNFFIILFLFIFCSEVLACNFKIATFGEPIENMRKMNPPPLILPDQFGGESLILPIEEICKNKESLFGTSIIYLYVENRLERIQLLRSNMDDKNLMKFAMEKYGDFKLPIGIPIKDWKGNHIWETSGESVEYISTYIHDGHAEILDISSISYSSSFENYLNKVSKWLDSQN